MGFLTYLDTPQSWSFSWCWIEVIGLMFAILLGLYQIYQLLKNAKGSAGIMAVVSALLILAITAAGVMTRFWTCRSALGPYA
jgi:hypothetical protein